ncbi:MAG: TIGR03084 family protein [Curvibacter sp.]|nr:TIGR03084 family protein [Curvibacter sp.]
MSLRNATECFLEECDVLAALLADLPEDGFNATTQFKDWSIIDILAHLHHLNAACEASLDGQVAFDAFIAPMIRNMATGGMRAAHRIWIGDCSGSALLSAWLTGANRLARKAVAADPEVRFPWFGPPMKSLSAISARQMETWAHGQELFDLLGVERIETDRIRNISHLGVITIPFAFRIRRLEIPDPPICVSLVAPSGAVWTWNDGIAATDRISGSAVDFCRTATQTRNVADTQLFLTGEFARTWGRIAQCFAGGPEDPPPPGSRFRSVG